MKILKKITIIILFIISINNTIAIEKSSINLENNPAIKNTDKNIKQAKLIEDETVKFKKNLEIIQAKYKLEKNKNINKFIKDLSEIIYILRKIQTTKVNKNTADSVIKIVINDLKNINLKTKKYLNNLKTELEKEREKYYKLSNNLNIILDKIIHSFINFYSEKKLITDKDRKILNIISKLNDESIKLKNFKYNNFVTKNDMRDYLIKILKEIKYNFKEIRQASKK